MNPGWILRGLTALAFAAADVGQETHALDARADKDVLTQLAAGAAAGHAGSSAKPRNPRHFNSTFCIEGGKTVINEGSCAQNNIPLI